MAAGTIINMMNPITVNNINVPANAPFDLQRNVNSPGSTVFKLIYDHSIN